MTEAGIAKLEREGDNEDTETTKADPSPERGRAANEEKEVCIYIHTRTPQSMVICKRETCTPCNILHKFVSRLEMWEAHHRIFTRQLLKATVTQGEGTITWAETISTNHAKLL